MGVTGWGGGSNDRGVGTVSAGDALDITYEVLSLLEVDPSLGTETENELLLIFAGI